MERLEGRNPEAEQNVLFDSLLVHTYWISRGTPRDREKFRGSLRMRLTVRAAALIYKAGFVRDIVLLAGKLKGPGLPAFSEVMEEELVEKYEIDRKHIVVAPLAFDTRAEDTEFLRISKERGWKNVANLGFRTHSKSRKKFMPPGYNDGVKVTHLHVEDIIREKDNHHVAHLVDRLTSSPYELGFKIYELIKDSLYRTSWGTNRSTSFAEKKTQERDLVAHTVDVFKS